MRLNRFLAAAGVGSRRRCDELIRAGRVTINGKLCTNFSAQPGPHDHVKVDGKLVSAAPALTIMLHKPRNCCAEFFSTASEQKLYNFTPSRPRVCALCCNRESIGRFAACLKLLGIALNILSVFDSEIFGLPICSVGIGAR